MSGDGEDSVTQWISDLRGGDRAQAPRLLWERYFERLARLAQARLAAKGGGPADGEDVALSVLDSFIRGSAAGRYPGLGGRDDLWRLLVTITARKAQNRRRDEGRQKRGAVGSSARPRWPAATAKTSWRGSSARVRRRSLRRRWSTSTGGSSAACRTSRCGWWPC
jgi:hypothetical protein